MVGIMKLSAPNTQRQTSEIKSPQTAGICVFADFQCSTNMTANMAVITKSSPSVLNLRTEPNIPPSVEPATQ